MDLRTLLTPNVKEQIHPQTITSFWGSGVYMGLFPGASQWCLLFQAEF